MAFSRQVVMDAFHRNHVGYFEWIPDSCVSTQSSVRGSNENEVAAIHMCPTIAAAFPALIFLEISRVPVSMYSAGVLLFVIGLWVAKSDLAQARCLKKVRTLRNLLFPLAPAVFGRPPLTGAQFLSTLVPSHKPWHF